jgi:hypothetical protein
MVNAVFCWTYFLWPVQWPLFLGGIVVLSLWLNYGAYADEYAQAQRHVSLHLFRDADGLTDWLAVDAAQDLMAREYAATGHLAFKDHLDGLARRQWWLWRGTLLVSCLVLAWCAWMMWAPGAEVSRSSYQAGLRYLPPDGKPGEILVSDGTGATRWVAPVAPVGQTLPPSCTSGTMHNVSVGVTLTQYYLCEAQDTWVLQGDGRAVLPPD